MFEQGSNQGKLALDLDELGHSASQHCPSPRLTLHWPRPGPAAARSCSGSGRKPAHRVLMSSCATYSAACRPMLCAYCSMYKQCKRALPPVRCCEPSSSQLTRTTRRSCRSQGRCVQRGTATEAARLQTCGMPFLRACAPGKGLGDAGSLEAVACQKTRVAVPPRPAQPRCRVWVWLGRSPQPAGAGAEKVGARQL